MLLAFTVIALFVGVGLIAAFLGSVRSGEEERSYRQNSREEDAWNWGDAPEVPITSTDDHYLHPDQPRTDWWPDTSDDQTSTHKSERTL